MTLLSSTESKEILTDWINSGSVVDPLGSGLRGTDLFAFDDLRKGSGKFPKVQFRTANKEYYDYRLGAPVHHMADLEIEVWFYTKQSKENIFDGYKNSELVEYWLDNKFRNAVLGSPSTIPSLSRPRFGDFSGVEKDPEFSDLYRGFIPVVFTRTEIPE